MARHGKARRGAAGLLGWAWQAWRGEVGLGAVGLGMARQARHGEAWQGEVGLGVAGTVLREGVNGCIHLDGWRAH